MHGRAEGLDPTLVLQEKLSQHHRIDSPESSPASSKISVGTTKFLKTSRELGSWDQGAATTVDCGLPATGEGTVA